MTDLAVLLKAYWELLHEQLSQNRLYLCGIIDTVLKAEVRKNHPDFDPQNHCAYKEAAVAFLDERIETYNPVGLQYLYDTKQRSRAGRLELDWFDSREEFNRLRGAAAKKLATATTDEQIRFAAEQLISELGAFPNASIIAGYQASHTLQKLPDYVLAMAIEQIIK